MRITMLAPFGIRPKGTLVVRMLPLAQALMPVVIEGIYVDYITINTTCHLYMLLS